jgi:hypothetical protein
VRPCDRVGDQALDARVGERALRHVVREPLDRYPDGGRERLRGGRQALLELALDVDGGEHLVDEVDAELLLDVVVGDDLVRRRRHLVGVEQLGLNPVGRYREEQKQRRKRDQRPHDRAMTPVAASSIGVGVHLRLTVGVSIAHTR